MGGYRLKEAAGGQVDFSRQLRFSWNGRNLHGHPGDSLASALLASGVRTVGRSFKYHRRRGVMTAGVEEPCAYVTLGSGAWTTPNTKAPMVELVAGLEVHGQNAWPGVGFDLGAASGLLSPFLTAGFYYKTFIGPGRGTRFWMFFERFIRSAAGMGRASREPDPDQYDRANGFCDVLVVGSGPAGLAAAETAAAGGLQVWLVEQDFALGGSLLAESGRIEDRPAADWRAERMAALEASGQVRILSHTTAFGFYDGGVVGLYQHLPGSGEDGHRGRFWVLRAGRTILATGAHERGFAFAHNDRPGVMLASAARTYVNRFRVAPGRRGVVTTCNDSGYAAARDLVTAGIKVVLCDARPEGAPGIDSGDFEVLRGAVPQRVLGRSGVQGVEIGDGSGTVLRQAACDFVAVSGGWNPVLHLACHRGMRPVWHQELAAFLPSKVSAPVNMAGAMRGIWDIDACAASGRVAAANAAATFGRHIDATPQLKPGGWRNPIRPLYEVRLPGQRGAKSFVDLQNDVTAADLRQAVQEGYGSAEHLKRYTTLGMSPDQGKTGNVIGLGILATARGVPAGTTGVTGFRPPYDPIELGALAGRLRGRHFLPTRRTPAHDWHYRQGAPMLDTGLWRRPWYYPQMGEGLEEAYIREAAAVRESVGFTDVSTLGKIAVQGPDAGIFLDRIYVNGFSGLPVGRARYGVMLRDDGFVLDDGTVWRLGEHEFFMTTTTAQAGPVMVWLERLLATRFAELRVHVTSVSDQWAGMAIAGPRAREVLAQLVRGIDVSAAAFKFMAVREGRIQVGEGDADCRVARITFSGELGYEIYVGADHADAVMEAVSERVAAAGGVPYGLEALGALRIEKGHVTAAELDGRVTLEDAGLGRMASKKKAYIGQMMATRPALDPLNRPQLVGIHPVEEGATFRAGSILCAPEAVEKHGVGWITAVTHSPALGHWIGLGFAEGGAGAWEGRHAVAANPVDGQETEVQLVSPHMYDPEGERQRD